MSHFSSLKTSLCDSVVLKSALQAMGFALEEATDGVAVRGFFGDSQPAEFKVLTKTHYDIGFVKTVDGSYEVIGDWELLPQVSQIERERFMTDLKKEYAKQSILKVAKERGYEVEVKENDDKTYELVVTQW